MPGHVKKNAGPDEDPTPYLVISLEMKREDAMKPYDSKKSYWCPDGKGGYMESMLESDDGNKALVICGGYEVRLFYHSGFWKYFHRSTNYCKPNHQACKFQKILVKLRNNDQSHNLFIGNKFY